MGRTESTTRTCSGAATAVTSVRQRRSAVVLACVLLTSLAAGCGSEEEGAPPEGTPDEGPPGAVDGDAATWVLLGEQDITAETETFEIGVTRLGCASGVTGEVLTPQVTYEPERIIVQVDVEPFTEDEAECPGNDTVPVTVELDEPVGERDLVDGGCLEGEEAAGTTPCEDEVRWS